MLVLAYLTAPAPSRRAPLPTGDACRRHRCAGSRSRVGLGHRLAAPDGTGTDDELEAPGGAGVSGELRATGQEAVAVAAADLAMDGRRCSPVQREGVMQGTKRVTNGGAWGSLEGGGNACRVRWTTVGCAANKRKGGKMQVTDR